MLRLAGKLMVVSNRPIALVTGASGGIGADFARELAGAGYDLVLAARRAEPMRALAAELQRRGAAATILVVDLSRPGAAMALVAELGVRGLEIEVLINNAGLGAAGPFVQNASERVAEMIMVNITALTELTRLLLPGMLARRRGKIMFVGSIAGFQPGPRIAVYSATKSYVLSFGEALAYELRGTGVTVTTLCPGTTMTDFFATADIRDVPRWRRMRSAVVAQLGYRALAAGRPVAVTGSLNRLIVCASRLIPHAIGMRLTHRMRLEDEKTLPSPDLVLGTQGEIADKTFQHDEQNR
jgi:uncharacterized protein